MKLLFVALAVFTSSALAKPMQKPISYQVDGGTFEGVLVWDDSVKEPRPGLLMVPNWLGINEANLKQAEKIAARDYVIFVADMYGKDVRPMSGAEAGKVITPIKADRALMRARVNQALATFKEQAKAAKVDLARVGAIGFCFGGTTVLELAKSGADLKGVVSFHGGLDAPTPTAAKPKARVLALHGANDPSVSAEELTAFTEDMKKSGADFMLVQLGNAVHSFTDPNANVPGRNMFDATANRRAFQMMANFFGEAFAP